MLIYNRERKKKKRSCRRSLENGKGTVKKQPEIVHPRDVDDTLSEQEKTNQIEEIIIDPDRT